MDEGVGDEKDDKNEIIDEVKEAECTDVTPPDGIDEEQEAACPDVTPPDDMEEGGSVENITRMK